MPKKRMSAEQIVVLLRQIEVQTGQGKTIQAACREAGISDKSAVPFSGRAFHRTLSPGSFPAPRTESLSLAARED